MQRSCKSSDIIYAHYLSFCFTVFPLSLQDICERTFLRKKHSLTANEVQLKTKDEQNVNNLLVCHELERGLFLIKLLLTLFQGEMEEPSVGINGIVMNISLGTGSIFQKIPLCLCKAKQFKQNFHLK